MKQHFRIKLTTLKVLGVVFLCTVLSDVVAQKADSVKTSGAVSDSLLNSHSPIKASIMSAIVPGLGQVYNTKRKTQFDRAKPNYLKVPLIYAGLGAGVYFLSSSVIEYNTLKAEYIAEIDLDPDYSNGQKLSDIEQSRRYAELSVIAIAAVYVLNIVDASVGAHLYHFDVSNDLAFDFQPVVMPSFASNNTFVGGTVSINF